MTQRALILGPGMDGSFLCDILLEKGHEVHLLHRRSSVDNLTRVAHCRDRLTLHQGDMADGLSIRRAVADVKPDLCFNTADQDNVGWSFATPDYSSDITFAAVVRLLEIVRDVVPQCKVFQPLSATMFGNAPSPQNEDTPLNPQSPYAVAKASAWHACRFYRKHYGVHVSCGIMFNHDSPRRGEGYLLHKIAKAAVLIARGSMDPLRLSNLELRVDIGYARDYMEAVVKMMELAEPTDVVLGTGIAWTIHQMATYALQNAGYGGFTQSRIVEEAKSPAPTLKADVAKARALLDFAPSVGIRQLIAMLVSHYKEGL